MYLQQQLAIHNNVIDVGTSHCLKCHCAVALNIWTVTMIDHVCAHMQKMSNKKEITYTIQVCDCTHYAVGRVLLC